MLPWCLRDYQQVGYWTLEKAVPKGPLPHVCVVGPEFSEGLSPKFSEGYVSEFYGLRPGVVLELYIRADLWEQFLNSRR